MGMDELKSPVLIRVFSRVHQLILVTSFNNSTLLISIIYAFVNCLDVKLLNDATNGYLVNRKG